MVVFASPNVYGRDVQVPPMELALRAPTSSSQPPSSSSLATPSSTKAPIATPHTSSSSSSTPTVAPTTRTPTPTSSPPTFSSSTTVSSTSPSVIFTTSTSTQPPVFKSSTSTIQSSSSFSSTSSTLSTPSAVTTFNLPPPTTYASTFGQLPQTSTSAIYSPARTSTAGSPKGFFANTGAVAGTFTLVGLVAVALFVTLFVWICKRHRAPDDADDALFEKIPVPTSYDGGGGARGLGSLSPIYPPVINPYADDAYTHANNARGGGYNYEPEQYGTEYPPGTAYTTQQHQDAYNVSRMPRAVSPTSTSYRYPNPFNSPISEEAPSPANNRDSSIAYGVPHDSQDSFYGARG